MRFTYYGLSGTIILLLALVVTACGRNASQDGLGRIAFDCLKNNDFERFSKYIIRKNEAIAVLQALRRSEQFSTYSAKKQQRLVQIQSNMEKRLHALRKHLRKNFNESFDHGVKNGVVWSRAEFLRIELAPEEPIFGLENLAQQHIYIIFKSGKKEFRLRLKNNIKVSRGWVMVDGFSWHDS